MEATHSHGLIHGYDRVKQAVRLETERAHVVREAIMSCANGGTVSIMGVYGGFMDKFPIGSLMNRSLTLKSGQAHVHRYLKPLLKRIENGEIDPSFVVSHHLALEDAPKGYEMFKHKHDNCTKVVLKP
jgi:threonine dehydrogenase-like Zn-dependent dehydrogenase